MVFVYIEICTHAFHDSQDVSFFLATDDPAVEERMKSRGVPLVCWFCCEDLEPQSRTKALDVGCWQHQSGVSTATVLQDALREGGSLNIKVKWTPKYVKYVMKFWLIHPVIVILRIPVFVVLFSLTIS